jgi:uncharacterized surface protein with fasciclin (FAS1) repeats
MTFRAPLVAAAAMAAIWSGAARAQDCMTVLAQNPQLSTFAGALSRTGQANLLRSPGPFTILAPNNEAISRVSVNIRTDVFGSQPSDSIDPIRAPAVVNAHIFDGKHTAGEVRMHDRIAFRSRNGNELVLQRGTDGRYTLTPGAGGYGAGGTPRMEPAHVVQADIPCSNGVIHIVDRVLVPTGM